MLFISICPAPVKNIFAVSVIFFVQANCSLQLLFFPQSQMARQPSGFFANTVAFFQSIQIIMLRKRKLCTLQVTPLFGRNCFYLGLKLGLHKFYFGKMVKISRTVPAGKFRIFPPNSLITRDLEHVHKQSCCYVHNL